MTDSFDQTQRSFVMRQIKGEKNLSTEIKLLTIFNQNKVTGWRRKFKLFGKPDFVFPLKRIAVFVDGCFWHGHGCRKVKPLTNQEYWERKIDRNTQRDREVNRALKNNNWKVIRIWECELKNLDIVKNKVLKKISIKA